jgi:hypothetical protein
MCRNACISKEQQKNLGGKWNIINKDIDASIRKIYFSCQQIGELLQA